MQGILKSVLIVAALAVVGYIGWTIFVEGTKPVSAGMSQSVQLAQTQAQSMNYAINSVSVAVTAPSAQTTTATKGSSESRSSSTTKAEPVEVASIADLDTLLIVWEPRYNAAKLAHAKFKSSIANAKNRAEEYFAQQQVITERMQDPDNLDRARQEDEADRQLYEQWKERANAALETADQIVVQLDDMNENLKKMELRAGFVFDASSLIEMPAAVAELNHQLADFQTSSENIKAVTRSPFETR